MEAVEAQIDAGLAGWAPVEEGHVVEQEVLEVQLPVGRRED